MSSKKIEAEVLLKFLGLNHFENVSELEEIVHPICFNCIDRSCLKTGKCPFVFSESQIEQVNNE